jgi:hypothetical protein
MMNPDHYFRELQNRDTALSACSDGSKSSISKSPRFHYSTERLPSGCILYRLRRLAPTRSCSTEFGRNHSSTS